MGYSRGLCERSLWLIHLEFYNKIPKDELGAFLLCIHQQLVLSHVLKPDFTSLQNQLLNFQKFCELVVIHW